MPEKPNILFAFADDWGRYASAYAEIYPGLNEHLKTPVFDRLAREGVLFTNAFVPAPSCTPCRSSVLTGRYFWNTGLGAILQCAEWDSSIPSYPLMLEEHGYHIGFTYKVWSPGTPKDEPYGGERTRYMPAGAEFGRFSHFVTEHATDHGIDGSKEQLYREVRDNFDAFLSDRPDGAPFCYWWGPTNTHRTWERGSGKPLWGIDPDGLEGLLPDFLPDVPEVREDVADYLGECMAFDAGLGVLLQRLEETGELDNTFIVVSGDHGIPGLPRGKCNLYDIGSEVALAVRWPGHVKGGRTVDDMINIMDLCPTFLNIAGIDPAEGMAGRSILDVLESPHNGQIDSARTSVVTGRERHVAAAREGNLPYPQRAIRTRDYLYIRNFAPDRWPIGDPRGLDDLTAPAPPYDVLCNDTVIVYADLDGSPTKAWIIHHRAEESVRDLFELGFGKRSREELYDVRRDPSHMKNLAEDSEYQTIRRQLSEQLEQELTRNRDPRLVDDKCRFDGLPFTAPFHRDR